MVKEFREINPSFARIFINHKSKKDPVTIDYPNKEGAFGLVFVMWTHILGRKFLWFMIGVFVIPMIPLTVEGSIYVFPFLMLLCVLLIGGIPFVLTCITFVRPSLYKRMPDVFAKSINEVKMVRKRKLNKRTFVIPMFDNVMMDYKMTGEFKKYLKCVEIREHDFSYVVKDKKGKVKSSERNSHEWWAKFEFTRIPKTGLMLIEFI